MPFPVDCKNCKRTLEKTPVIHCKTCQRWYCPTPNCGMLNDEPKKKREYERARSTNPGSKIKNQPGTCAREGCKGKIDVAILAFTNVAESKSPIIYDVPLIKNWGQKQFGPLCWYFSSQMLLSFHEYSGNSETHLLEALEIIVDILVFRNKSIKLKDPTANIKSEHGTFVGRYINWVRMNRPQSFYTIDNSVNLYATKDAADAANVTNPDAKGKTKPIGNVRHRQIDDKHYHVDGFVNANWVSLTLQKLSLLKDPAFVKKIHEILDRHSETLVTSRARFLEELIPELRIFGDNAVDTVFFTPAALSGILSKHGPLVCGGNFFPTGIVEVDATKTPTQYPLSSPTARKLFRFNSASKESHAVVLCGVEIVDNGDSALDSRVFFIDPNRSDRLLTTSFKAFKDEIIRFRYTGMMKQMNLYYLECVQCSGDNGVAAGHCATKVIKLLSAVDTAPPVVPLQSTTSQAPSMPT